MEAIKIPIQNLICGIVCAFWMGVMFVLSIQNIIG